MWQIKPGEEASFPVAVIGNKSDLEKREVGIQYGAREGCGKQLQILIASN